MTAPDKEIGDPALSRLYHSAPSGEPPAALDAAILAAARATTLPQRRPRPWWQRLQLPVTLAATVVLAVMLSLTVDRHPPGSDDAAPTRAPREDRARPALPAAPAAQPAPEAVEASPAASAGRAKSAPRPAIKQESSAPATRAKPAEPAAAPPPPEASDSAAAVPPAPAAAASSNRASPAEAEAKVLQRAESRKADAAPPAATAGALSREAAGRPTPEAWIEEIRQLRRQGRQPEADRRLREFRAAFPGYPLPEDLRPEATSGR